MDKFHEQFRTICDAFLLSISELHGNAAPVHVSKLACCVRDILEAQEGINRLFDRAMRKERTSRLQLERRLLAIENDVKQQDWRFRIEKSLQSVKQQLGNVDGETLTNRVSALENIVSKQVYESDEFPVKTGTDKDARTPRKRKRELDHESAAQFSNAQQLGTQQSPPKPHADKPYPNGNITPSRNSRPGPHSAPPPPDPIVTLHETPPPQRLPPLPKVSDILKGLEKRQRERRRQEKYRPPACPKCRLRKRALMSRQHGYIDEDKFESWARKPGGCFENVHQDEEPDENAGSLGPLSFSETETQSPPKDVG